ncbi:hypothetical protein ACFLWB_02180 [Chloroflexota bacterium]
MAEAYFHATRRTRKILSRGIGDQDILGEDEMETVNEQAKVKYFDKLAEVAGDLASNCAKLRRHSGKFYSNIIDGGYLHDSEYMIAANPELPDREDGTRLLPVDEYLAKNLLVNLKAEFKEFAPIKDWRKLTRKDITGELIDRL